VGYNDGFFLHGTLLAIFRRIGTDPFQLVDWSFRSVGFIAIWVLAKRYFRWPVFVCALAATLFVTANAYYPHVAIHAQLLACYLFPLLAVFQIEIFKAARYGSIARFAVLSLIFGVLVGSLLMTSFYAAFFFGLIDFLVLAFLTIRSGIGAKRARMVEIVQLYAGFLAAQIVILLVCAIPFLMVYLPKAAETGMHGFAEISAYALRPTDIVNVGPYNLLWSNFLQATIGVALPSWLGGFESQTGATPALLAIFFLGGLSLRKSTEPTWQRNLLFAMWCTSIFLFVLVIRWPYGPWLWGLIYRFVPGAAAVRVISRIQLALLVPMILVVCNFIAEGWRESKTKLPLILITGLLVVEQVNDFPVFNIDRATENNFISSIQPAPASCDVFFAENSRPGVDIDTSRRHNVDAVIVSELFGKPTINGYATFIPPHWNLVHPQEPGYLDDVHAWLTSNPVDMRLCGLNFRTGEWRQMPPLTTP